MAETVTLRDIAEKVGVTVPTVSRVLRKDPGCYISEANRRAIFELAEALNYTPNPAARDLALGRVSNVGFVTGNLVHLGEHGPFILRQIEGMQEGFRKRGFTFSVLAVPQGDLKALEGLCAGKSIAGLVFGTGVLTRPEEEFLARSGVPSVVVGESVAADSLLSHVVSDKVAGTAEAVRHLKELGHRDIAHYGFSDTASERFRETMRMNDLPVREELLFDFESANVYARMHEAYMSAGRLLEKRSRFTAVVCANDFTALGLCRRFTEEGLAVGRDVSVVGFDDVEDILGVKPEERFLTTVHKPNLEMGQKSAELLLSMIDRRERKPVSIQVPCHLAVRKSSGPAMVRA